MPLSVAPPLERRAPSDAEQKRRKALRATQAEVREDFRVLAFVTAQRLDDTVEVEQLNRQIQMINAGLKDDLSKLKRVEKYAKTAAKVSDALAKAADKLADLAAKLPV